MNALMSGSGVGDFQAQMCNNMQRMFNNLVFNGLDIKTGRSTDRPVKEARRPLDSEEVRGMDRIEFATAGFGVGIP